ncbi:uncharacterized protein C8Q71DRAFT_779917 [Rhodofomes roseus]|uniref:Uncharacterized protein n=1 Tax=Rhodofomes roseus TaxID=34475 RepID=A0ABQ8K570_9APHY|nr:uncharacterized protein C8Q71DRAFT_779891 [Rhodofomes roseus]XP_047775158.1 uncharacterized protein C8Q71DRAFT_779917 [Rhodofomes roseus]KAH9832107.1 hypothetical protein C8Q71DRAFT_779891 [Rhodofomes roseus]KAH9832112.1 hypothetical protein C8Q71DRAFT_779917 [Rhodofomes roseus]
MRCFQWQKGDTQRSLHGALAARFLARFARLSSLCATDTRTHSRATAPSYQLGPPVPRLAPSTASQSTLALATRSRSLPLLTSGSLAIGCVCSTIRRVFRADTSTRAENDSPRPLASLIHRPPRSPDCDLRLRPRRRRCVLAPLSYSPDDDPLRLCRSRRLSQHHARKRCGPLAPPRRLPVPLAGRTSIAQSLTGTFAISGPSARGDHPRVESVADPRGAMMVA